MRIKEADVSRVIYFVAVDATDLKTRETSLTGTAVYFSIDSGPPTAMTTPTITALDAVNMPGVFKLAIDEAAMVTISGDMGELALHITATEMADVTRVVEIVARSEADIYDRVGAPVGASISADIASVDSSVGALNDLSAAQVNTEVDTALTDYDGPTKAEMDSGFAALNDPTAAVIADAVWDEAISGHVGAGTFGAKNQKVVPSETIGDYKADVSALATSAEIAALNDPTAAAIADAVWDEAIAGHVAAGSFGAKNQKVVPSESANDYKADVSGLSTFDPTTDEVDVGKVDGTSLAGKVGRNFDFFFQNSGADTTKVVDSVGNGGDGRDWTDSEKTQVRQALGITGTKLATASGNLDTVKAKTDNLPASPAAVGSAMTLETNAVDAAALATDAVNEIRDAIFAKTGITAGGSVSFTTILARLNAWCRGRINVDGDDFEYYDDDGDVSGGTKLLENRRAAAARTPQ